MLRLVACTLVGLLALSAPRARADAAAKQAAQLFQRRFADGSIKGTGHLFAIVVECDRERLAKASAELPRGETRVVEYAFTFVQHTREKAQSRIEGGDLDPAVQRCILDTYLAEVTFASGPWAPAVVPMKVAFPVVLSNGKKPLVPATPIFFAAPE